jgi:hypothetical protein
MTLNYLVLITALIISGVAAYYSIVGLTAIFAAAFWSIVIMGTVLELGKIVTSVWLKKYWNRVTWQLKLYLTSAVAVLMLITSLGIFGFLSRAHLEQGVPTAEVAARVSILDDAIAVQTENITTARAALTQLDEQVNQRLSRGASEQGAERAVQIRRQQTAERTRLQAEIAQAQKTISSLTAERAPIASELRKVESEVGPIKYVAALIYGDNPEANLLERAVRWMIIIIVLVFDPLAIALILAANSGIRWEQEDQHAALSLTPEPKPEPVQEPEPEPDTKPTAIVASTPDPEHQLDQELVDFRDTDHAPGDVTANQNTDAPDPESGTISLDELDPELWNHDDFQGASNNVSFGTQFPSAPRKSDMFLRVDYFPSRLFKFTGSKWTVVDKQNSDTWLLDDKYIDHLIEQIAANKVSVDDLIVREQELVTKRLKSKT